MMRRIVLFAATAALVLAASGGTALAAGQQVCIGGPGAAVSTPNSSGQCKKSETLTTLATESEVTSLQSTVSDLQGRVSTLESANTALTGRVSALETTLSKVSYTDSGLNGKPTLQLTGANLQIVSGSGSTSGTVNGEGNLIIGYDENQFHADQTGSNNLVLGNQQSFTSYGGLIAGQGNTLSGPFADAFGFENIVRSSGSFSSVSGGSGNIATGAESSISGGVVNQAIGNQSSISGGGGNQASGHFSSVSGGSNNAASGEASSILGGVDVTVSADGGTSP